VAASANTVAGVLGVLQVETATINGTTEITTAGDADVVVTAAGMPNSPKTVRFAVALADDEANVADKARTALGLNADVSGFFTITGAGADIVLTAKTKAADDATMNLASDNADTNGIVEVAASANTQAGVAGTLQVETATVDPASAVTVAGDADVIVTGALVAGTPLTIRFAVTTDDDTPAKIAAKARTAMNIAAITDNYTLSGAGADIVLTTKVKAADDVTLNMASQNAASNGVVDVANSANSVAGVAGTLQVETATVTGSITSAGNVAVIVTCTGMTGTPKTFAIPVDMVGADPGTVEIAVVGTGLASNVNPFAMSNAYTSAGVTPIDCTGKTRAHVLAKLMVDDLRSLPDLSIVPFFANQTSENDWHQGALTDLNILTGAGQCLEQKVDVDVQGATGLAVLVDSIAGQGASVDIWIELS